MQSMRAVGYTRRIALPTSPGPQQRSSARMAWLRGKGIADAISSRSLVFEAPCSARHNSSSSSMWPWSRASISAWLMGGDCIRVWLLVLARIARTGSTVLYVLDRSAQKGDVAHERFGRHAGELPEIPDEMRLVDVSAAGRQVGPPNRDTSIFR